MQINRIQTQNYNTNRPAFKKFTITPHAEELATRTPEKIKLIEYAKKIFANSEAVNFSLKDYLVPKILVKETNEILIGPMKASALENNKGLRVSDRWTELDFVLPRGVQSSDVIEMINKNEDEASRAIQIAQLMERSAKEHNGRYLI